MKPNNFGSDWIRIQNTAGSTYHDKEFAGKVGRKISCHTNVTNLCPLHFASAILQQTGDESADSSIFVHES
jgi:hypothetical protein